MGLQPGRVSTWSPVRSTLHVSQLHFYLTCISDTSKHERTLATGPNIRKTPIFTCKNLSEHGQRKKSARSSCEVSRAAPEWPAWAWEKPRKSANNQKLDVALRPEQCSARFRGGHWTMRWNWQCNQLRSELTMGRQFIFNLSDQGNGGSSVRRSPGGGEVMEITSHRVYFCMAVNKRFHWVGRTACK